MGQWPQPDLSEFSFNFLLAPREVSVVFFSMCAVTATFSAASPFWNYCYATWEREKENKINAACVCRIMRVCVEMTDPYPVSGACSSRVSAISYSWSGACDKGSTSREAAPAPAAAAAIIKPFSVFISSNITLTLFLSLSFSGALCSVKRRS